MVSPQSREHSRAFKEEKGFTFEILSDPGNRVAAEYRLVYSFPEDLKEAYGKLGIHLEEYNPEEPWTLPMPSRYIIARDGVIRYARVSADHTVRPDPAETVEALESLKG